MTLVTATTGLFDALMADEGDLLGRWTAYEPKFKEFAKVLTDEATAKRLTIADVSRMLDVPAADLVAIAHGGTATRQAGAVTLLSEGRPAWAEAALAAPRKAVDAAAILANGHEPLHAILEAVDRLAPDAVLVVKAPFHPKPLRRLLATRGFDSFVDQPGPDVFHAYFRRVPTATYRPEAAS